MDQRRRRIVGSSVAALALVSAIGCTAVAGDGQVPILQVDGLWPMPLEYPNILGPVSGVTVAPDGNILIVTRQDGFSSVNEINSVTGSGDCCTPTQAVLEYTPDGELVREWGGPDQGYPWPERPHGIAVDPDGNIWIGGGAVAGGGGAGRGGRAGGAGDAAGPTGDTFILKFSREGQHLMTIGAESGESSSQSMDSFGGANRFSFDSGAGEVYVADGFVNHRVAVLDIETGEVLRSWGAYGNPPDDAQMGEYDPSAAPSQQFRSVTCAELSDDDLVYVCDRGNNRIQVFETDGTFVAETIIAPATLGGGSVWDVAFSPDEQWIYVADGSNERVHIVNRETLEVMSSFGTGGRYPGHFLEVGSVAVDDDGNVYTAEDGQGKRIQKWVVTGTTETPPAMQGVVYPGQ